MKRYACIFIGTNRCSLRVAQRASAGRVNILEKAEYPVEFGVRVFQEEKQRDKTVSELCRIIQEYIGIAEQSDPERIEIYLSAALRRAIDSIYIYERVRLASRPYPVHIITDEEELLDFCKAMMIETLRFMPPEELQKPNLFVNIKGDSTLLGCLKGGYVTYVTRIPLGYGKLTEMMESIIESSETFARLMTEIITNYLKTVHSRLGSQSFEHIFVSTVDFPGLLRLAGSDLPIASATNFECDKQQVNTLYQSTKDLTPRQLFRKFPVLNMREADTVQLTLLYCRALLDVFSADSLYMMPSDTASGITVFQFKQTMAGQIHDWIEKSGYQCALTEASRFQVDMKAAAKTEYFALRFFDTLKKRFGFSRRMRYLTRICAQLATAGNFFGTENRSIANSFIIEHTNILGLTREENDLCARVCRHVTDPSYVALPEDPGLNEDEQLMMAQIVSLIKLAQAMDASTKQKIHTFNCQLTQNEFIVRGQTTKNVSLEEYDFRAAGSCFKQVFGLKPSLKIKRVKI